MSSKTSASEEARRTLWYVESLRDARTPLADFFSILLEFSEFCFRRANVRGRPVDESLAHAFS